LLVDDHAVGTTLLVTTVRRGPQQLTLRRSGALEATREVDVPAAGNGAGRRVVAIANVKSSSWSRAGSRKRRSLTA
ncbi:MAG TPA: hypothetical protein VGK33_23275, partial [Chloroflexota bacterium]